MKNRVEKYIFTVEFPNPGKKTRIWGVYSKSMRDAVGVIKWHGAWRKYCFFPSRETLFDSDCLKMLVEFLEKENGLHRKTIYERNRK